MWADQRPILGHPACKHQLKRGACPNKQCLFPKTVFQLQAGHKDYVTLLRKLPGIAGN